MSDTKKWYQSKAIWAGIVAFGISMYNVMATTLAPTFGFSLPVIPDWIFGILAGLGIYSRTVATKTIQ